jgi:predicted nuclease of predicted toxin-antitoxin system
VKPLGFPLLADENVHPDVVVALAREGRSVRSVLAEGLGGRDDATILRHAHTRGWVVLTHDSDFGTLAVRGGQPYTGIVFLRPGHIDPVFVLAIVAAIDSASIDVVPPFIVVAERQQDSVRVRVRQA